MTIAGQRADTITPVSIADEVLVNRDGTTARQAIDSLAAQLANTGPIAALGDAGRLFQTFAEIPAASSQQLNFSVVVYNDPDGNKNGTWTVQLIGGVKTWDYAYPLREGAVITARDEGEGTANAIEAVSKSPVSDGQFVKFKPFRDNGSGIVTVSFNGDTPLTIRDPGGSNVVAASGLKAGVTVSGFRNGTFFDLITDILASASAASAANSAAVALNVVGGLGSLTAAIGAAEASAELADGHKTDAASSATLAIGAQDQAEQFSLAALAHVNDAYTGRKKLYPSWTGAGGLSGISGTEAAETAEVDPADTGTHTDPVVGGTVPNSGRFNWSVSPAGWRWIGPPDQELNAIEAMRSSIWLFAGDGDPAQIPQTVTTNGKVLSSLNATTGEFSATAPLGTTDFAVAIDGGDLYRVGGASPSSLIDSALNWVSAQIESGSISAVFKVASDLHARRIGKDNSFYIDGQVVGITGDGQSNQEGQAGSSAAAVLGANPFPRLRMPATSANNVWLGKTTTGGSSVELTAAEITGLTAARDVVAPTGTHGTPPALAACYRFMTRARAQCAGWTPDVVTWLNSEGGETIANMLNDAPAGEFYFDNLITATTKVRDLVQAEGKSFVYRWMLMAQGESDSADAALGSKHDTLRSQVQAAVVPITGQTEDVLMLSSQMSSFFTNSAGARSILDYARANAASKLFFCLGPTYIFPFSTEDFLHQTSVGHAMHGEMQAVAMAAIERTGAWTPLHMVSASITGANQITVTLSEAAQIDTGWLVAAIANQGIAVGGKTVTNVTVSGTSMVITTSEAAAGATSVQAAMVGHTSPTRTLATIPRSTIRSVASYGQFYTGQQIHKPLCHQQISIT